MEYHSNTARAFVTAAFCRAMKNLPVQPEMKPIAKQLTLYHCLPYGLADPLRKPIEADFYIDVESFIENKVEMRAKHKSHKEWLDVSQGLDAFLITMKDMRFWGVFVLKMRKNIVKFAKIT